MASFQELQSLVQLVTDHSQQPLPLLGKWERQTSKETTLFENIRNGRYTDDQQANTDLYGNDTPDKRYAMLKARLYQKLLNHLVFLDFNDPRFAPSAASEHESLTLLHQAKLLIHSTNHEPAEDLLKRSLKIALELGFTSICLECLEWWRHIHVKHGRLEAFRKNHQQLTHFRAISDYEREAEDLFQSVRVEMRRPVHIRKKYLVELPAMLLKLKAYWERDYSPNVFGSYYLLNIWYYELIGDFAEIIRITTESQLLLSQGRVNPLRFDAQYNKYVQVYAYLRIKDYGKGLELAEKYLPDILSSSPNWFAYMENYFLMAAHAWQYELALQLLTQVDGNRFLWKLTQFAKEKWILYSAYLYLVYQPNKLSKRFNLKNITQTLPESTKDKQGFNVAILLLQFLYELQRGDLDVLQCRVESMKQYTKRYLSDRNARRSRLFIRLLVLAVVHQLNAVVCRKKGQKIFNQLNITSAPGDAFAEIEVIPYEHLWEWVLRTMESLL